MRTNQADYQAAATRAINALRELAAMTTDIDVKFCASDSASDLTEFIELEAQRAQPVATVTVPVQTMKAINVLAGVKTTDYLAIGAAYACIGNGLFTGASGIKAG